MKSKLRPTHELRALLRTMFGRCGPRIARHRESDWTQSRAAVRRSSRRLRHDERGLVLLFWALSFLGILAFLALVADSGLVFVERRSMQNIADASALAGARDLFINGEAAGQATAISYANDSDPDLTFNTATASAATSTVTSNVGDEAGSFLGGGVLSFGSPEVRATATARVGAAVLPGPGVFCVGSHVDTVVAANAANAALFAPLAHMWLVPWALADEYYTVLRFGAGSGSNAGYVDIGDAGGASQAVRTCFEDGSVAGLQPVEPTQTGIAAGPAAQGLQARLAAAALNGCASWDAITSTLIAAGGADGLVEGDWQCSPYKTQATSIVLLPVMQDPFQDTPGSTNVDVYFDAVAGQYELAYFWLDTERTFDTSSSKWKWWGPAGQIEIHGVYLGPFLTELTLDGAGSGGTVACVLGVSSGCFLELTN